MSSAVKLYFFIIIQTYFLGFIVIPSFVAKGLALGTLFITIATSNYRCKYYNKILKAVLAFTIINMVWCSVNRAQTPIEYIIGSEFTSMLCILSLFAIPSFHLDNKAVERVLEYVGVTIIIVYLLEYFLHIPLTMDAGDMEEFGESMRLRINGQCVIPLLYFKSLTKLTEKISVKYILLFLFCILCVFILGFRSQIAVLAFLSVVYFWKNNLLKGKNIFYILVTLGILLVFIQNNSVIQYKIGEMEERNETQNFDNEDYVRLRTYEYYTEILPNNIVDKVVGIGLPNANSQYGKHIQDLKDSFIVWADWGVIGLSWVWGIPTVICFILLFIKGFLTPVSREHSYLCYWCIFMVGGSIMTREIYRIGAFPIEGVVLYLVAQYRTDEIKLKISSLWKKKTKEY